MKKAIAAIILGITLLCYTVLAESDECTHRYKLFPYPNEPGRSGCLCHFCEDYFQVYSADFVTEVPPADEGGACSHLFRRAENPHQVSIESASEWTHEPATWYYCTCELCGAVIEAYLSDGRFYDHVHTAWEGSHVDGSFKHLYTSYCDNCGEFFQQLVNCMSFEDGSCEDPYNNPQQSIICLHDSAD